MPFSLILLRKCHLEMVGWFLAVEYLNIICLIFLRYFSSYLFFNLLRAFIGCRFGRFVNVKALVKWDLHLLYFKRKYTHAGMLIPYLNAKLNPNSIRTEPYFKWQSKCLFKLKSCSKVI